MKITVVDCATTGHRETYYKQFVRTLKEMGEDVSLLAPDGEEVDASVTFVRITTKALLPLPSGRPLAKKMTVVRNALIRLRNLRTVCKSVRPLKPDLLFFACLDDMLPTLFAPLMNIILPYRWSGLLVQSSLPPYRSFAPDVRPALRNKRNMGIGVLNEYSIDSLRPFCKKEIVLFPDFADLSEPDFSYPLYQRLQEKARDRKVVSIIGSLNRRKGTELFRQCIEKMSPQSYFFFMAGRSSLEKDEEEQFRHLEETRDNCLFSFEKIPDESSFNALVSGSHLIFAVYRHFTGSSNLLTKAAAFHKPIIVSKSFCMGKRVTTYRTGLAVPEDEADACITGIEKLCSADIDVANYDRYTVKFDKNALSACFKQIIQTL
jgi:hypothetical protein